MRVRTLLWLIGVVVLAVALAQAAAVVVALAQGEPWLPFANSLAFGLAAGSPLVLAFRRTPRSLDQRSALLAVTLCWGAACLFGAGPFFLHPALGLSALDALFESVSGFTTTGATGLVGLDRLPRSLLLWRSATQWLGGMGVVLLGVAVLPVLGLGGMQVYRADTVGPTKDTISPRIVETARLLWTIYVGLTVVAATCLWFGGLEPFDAVCHALTAISTGGFSTRDASLGAYDSGFVHATTTLFMLLGGTSFAVLHRLLTQGIEWRSYPELRLYAGILLCVSVLIAFDLGLSKPDQFPSAADAVEHALFQTASILTTTGYHTSDWGQWPPLSQALLLALFFVGGMAGSTAGGVKVVRVLITFKLAFSQFFRLVHPHGFGGVKLRDRTLDESVILGVLGFVGLWLVALLAGTLLLAGFGSDLFTSFSVAAASLANAGPGLAGAGSSAAAVTAPPGAKLVMMSLMLLGRLEIYSILVLFTAGFWRD